MASDDPTSEDPTSDGTGAGGTAGEGPAHGPADSAGVPWGGRTLPRGGFSGDTGEADPGLAAALASYQEDPTAVAGVVAALAGARLLVPVVAVLDEAGEGAHGLTSDKSADMAVVTLTGADGRTAMPVFTSTQALSQWRSDARPVPVEASRAALSAVAEGCELLVLDAAGPVTCVVRRPAVWALAQGREWTPSWQDPEVAQAVEQAATAEGLLSRCERGESAELRVVLGVRAGLSADEVQALVRRVGEHLARSEVVAERVDGLEVRVLPA